MPRRLGSKLTDQLLTFARRRHMDAQVIQLNDLVVEHHRHAASDARRAHHAVDVAGPRRVGNPGRSRSVPERHRQHGGQRTRCHGARAASWWSKPATSCSTPTTPISSPSCKPGEYVQLSISDTGTGMPPEVRDRVFEPFFTTKEKGRGTGLGLAMVYGFVKQSGGHVTIYSEVGHGTTINLYFPRVDGARRWVQYRAKIKASVDPRARETILVVEDDDRVRQLTIKRLKMIGYQVLEASDGPRRSIFCRRDHAVDLVFTDLIMPGGLSGREVAIRARELKPGIKVLLTSGYAEELVHGDDLQREQLKVLRKPYQQADLVAALREVLAGGAGTISTLKNRSPCLRRPFDGDQGACASCPLSKACDAVAAPWPLIDQRQTKVSCRVGHCQPLAIGFLLSRGHSRGRIPRPAFRRRHVRFMDAIAQRATRCAALRAGPRQLQLPRTRTHLRG